MVGVVRIIFSIGHLSEKIASKMGKFLFQKPLFKNPFQLVRVSFCTPNLKVLDGM